MTNFIDFIGRLFISSVFLLSGYNKFNNFDATVNWMEGIWCSRFFIMAYNYIRNTFAYFHNNWLSIKISAIILALFSVATAIIFHSDFTNQMQL